MNVLGLIPARGGSKGVPGKNIRLLNGKPLLAYTAEAALNSKLLVRTILSTDDKKIARVGMELGIDTPFIRPKELATDITPTYPVIMHALEYFRCRGEEYDAVCLLQPVTPLRDSSVIDGCIKMLINELADTVITTMPVPPKYHPNFVYLEENDRKLKYCMGEHTIPIPRQKLPAAVCREGSVYVTTTRTLIQEKSIYGKKVCGFSVLPERSVNIDTMEDWYQAENLIKSHLK